MVEYRRWLRERHDVRLDRRTASHFETVAVRLRSAFEASAFWTSTSNRLKEYDERYLVETGYSLLMRPDERPELLLKPFDSFLLKTFRKNVVDNSNWPEEPHGGWVLPAVWYTAVHDIVRTSIIVKFLDGVEFLCERLASVCGEAGLVHDLSFEAREEGYYAAHFSVPCLAEVPDLDWNTFVLSAKVEIQVTTQLQEVIRRLLHRYYEERRGQPTANGPDSKWQWNYRSDEFVANYLGHILHYLEGMIVEVRDRSSASERIHAGGTR